jgi:protein-L-isoaspartate(D-aspartate) O-methyltransferase
MAARSSRFVQTPSGDPAHVYHNALIALDADKGINNGEPLLHAMWLAKVAPQPGETVVHVGTGGGYYTALLARLVAPQGTVTGFEVDAGQAAAAARNLAGDEQVAILHADAVTAPLPPTDIVYVNAGAAAPPVSWLKALKPGGRLVFPWRPSDEVALAMLVTRRPGGYACRSFMRSWFIPCAGASGVGPADTVPARDEAARVRSIRISADAPPNDTAVAIIGGVWFSTREI